MYIVYTRESFYCFVFCHSKQHTSFVLNVVYIFLYFSVFLFTASNFLQEKINSCVKIIRVRSNKCLWQKYNIWRRVFHLDKNDSTFNKEEAINLYSGTTTCLCVISVLKKIFYLTLFIIFLTLSNIIEHIQTIVLTLKERLPSFNVTFFLFTTKNSFVTGLYYSIAARVYAVSNFF